MTLAANVRFALALGGLAVSFAAGADPVGPAPGNALNPAPINPSSAGRWMDADGIGTRIPAARTPSGVPYNIPHDPNGEAEEKAEGWITSGYLELGALGVWGDERRQGWLNYKDLRDGAYLNGFAFAAEKPREARFMEVTGGAAGRDDQFYRARGGRHNDWRITAWFDELPQVFTTTYRSLWSGIGTERLTLTGLAPGGTTNANTTQANVVQALGSTPPSELQVLRRTAGARIEKKLSDSWSVHAALTDETRKGARPFGAVFGGGGGGGNMEVAESVDSDTVNLSTGLQYRDAAQSFNVRAAASLFDNKVETLTFQNPVFISTTGSTGLDPTDFTEGRFALAPDNQHYNVRAEYARALPEFFRGNFTATVALGSMRQDEDLLAPTAYSLAGGTVTAGGVPLANVWNTPEALSRRSADLRVDTIMADVNLSARPANGLDVRGKVRYQEADYSGQYEACNPLTGQWGRILNDGSGLSIAGASTAAGANPPGTTANAYNAAACNLAAVMALGLAPATGNVPIRTAENDYERLVASLSADYRLGRAASVNALYERENVKREWRERDETHEDRVKLTYVDRGTLDGTIRLSWEQGRRGGGAYDTTVFDPLLSAGLGPTPAGGTVAMPTWIHTIGQFRSFDLADRRQDVLNGRVDYSLHEGLDGAVTLQVKDASYPSEYGLTGNQRAESLTLDLGYQLGSNFVVYGYYTHQRGTMDQKGIHPNGCTLGQTYYFFSDGRVLNAATGAAAPATPAGTTLLGSQAVGAGNWREVCSMAAPFSPLFPESRAWEVDSRDRSNVAGFGARYELGRVKLDMTFNRTLGRTRIGYRYNATALGLSAAQVALAGDGLTDLSFAQNVFDASAWMPVNDRVSLRLLVRHESGKVRDWHYDGIADNPMPTNNAVYLDSGPQDYRTTAVGLLFHIRF
ncbi:MAG TPA: MtrB/PioB family outer membrane beta-barrel protein [Usitatibacter sp.]|nr:MtrB/PioB family outer membrane beta-barrel protein [Usitatibacter sp.]